MHFPALNKPIKFIILISLFIIFIFAGFFIGRESGKENLNSFKSFPLRVSGFDFVRPLLVCDTNSEKKFPELNTLNNKLNSYIAQEKEAKNIDSASVYFQDFATDGRININPDEKFHPASLTKVPTMIAILRMAESSPDILSEKLKYDIQKDENEGQEIKPKIYAQTGNVYSIEDLIEMMIEYSDNNSLSALLTLLNKDTLKTLYSDLHSPFLNDPLAPQTVDFITAKDISYFFRILYNATYLTSDLCDKALQILSETDYKNGLVAGVPDNVKISHKFGLETIRHVDQNNNLLGIDRELHDCGIIYHPKDPYLLCVMTKSSAGIPAIENVIKNISAITYKEVDGYSK